MNAGCAIATAGNSEHSLNASTAGGGNVFVAVNEALTQGTFTGNTTLVGASAGSDTFAVFSAGSAPPAHTIVIENWQASDSLFLGNYSAADLATANAALAGAGATFTLSDQTTIAFVGNHPSVAA